MAIDSDIRDQAYQFFTQEAPELLQLIETELLTLKAERNTAKVHNLMRAAHSIKGGAASVGLETIKTLAHSLEDIFKSLHSPELEIDGEVESLLLSAYDCLRLPLMEQINVGRHDSAKAMAMAEPVFAQIEERLGDFLRGSANLPSSVELGVDIALSIFEVDVTNGLDRLAAVIAAPEGEEVAGELGALAEVFAGIAELLELPGFGEIAQRTQAALHAQPDRALHIAQIALDNFRAATEAVIAGDRTTGGVPSSALIKLATTNLDEEVTASELQSEQSIIPQLEIPAISSLEVLGDFFLSPDTTPDEFSIPVMPIELLVALHPLTSTVDDEYNQVLQQFFDAELLDLTATQNSADVFASPSVNQESTDVPSLEDIFGDFVEVDPTTELTPVLAEQLYSDLVFEVNDQENIQELVQSIQQQFDRLPTFETSSDDIAATEIAPLVVCTPVPNLASNVADATPDRREAVAGSAPTPQLSVRVDLDRLERINNLVGELSINRNSLSLQNEQLQGSVQELLRRFTKFQEMGRQLRALSDQMLVAPERGRGGGGHGFDVSAQPNGTGGNNKEGTQVSSPSTPFFDSLEMDSYGELNSLLQETFEEIVQLEETVGDVVLLAGQSSQTLEQQRQMLGNLRDDVMWARMLPIGEVLNRFPRILRDLSTSYEKPVDLKITGTGVLVDKAAIEKLYDPLLHLLRNAFDHGIEQPEVRMGQGKQPEGRIDIRAYHQGSQTIIEVRDDGQGINLDRIRSKANSLNLWSPEQLAAASPSSLLELLFEPGFSTAAQVSQLSGRGIGLDVVRSQVRSLKGSVAVTSEPGKGTTFTLRIPLTLTIAKLLVCIAGNTAFALPSDSITEILIPEPEQVKKSGGQRFLYWRERIVMAHHLSEILEYSYTLPTSSTRALASVPAPEEWAAPMLVIEQDEQIIALEIDRLVTELELVIKPFGTAITPPDYIYGCTILGDGSLIPVIDATTLLDSFMQRQTATKNKLLTAAGTISSMVMNAEVDWVDALPTANQADEAMAGRVSPHSLAKKDTVLTLLVVDDSITVRQTLVLTLQKFGYRVLQARDGREAIEQLQQDSTISLIICDIEMPNMNGFEFLSYRRQDPLMLKIPVVMLTSRSSEKHRRLAMYSGANSYFTKPYIEQELLAGIEALLKQAQLAL